VKVNIRVSVEPSARISELFEEEVEIARVRAVRRMIRREEKQ
jgi:hypothetical protein